MNNIIDRLERIMNIKGLSDNKLTVDAGLSIGLIGKARKKRSGLHSDTIEKILYAYPDINPTWFITGKGEEFINTNQPVAQVQLVVNEPKVSYVPRVVTVNSSDEDAISIVPHKVAAGYLNGYADPEFIENLPTIAAPGYRGGLHRAFEIRGNSMPPLHSGSISIGRFEESITGIRNRRVYIIVTKNEGIVLKRVINDPEQNRLILISDNPNKREFGNYTVDYEDILEIWYWRGALIRELPDPSDLYNRMNEFEVRITQLEENAKRIQSHNSK